jgi:hypothetical protein
MVYAVQSPIHLVSGGTKMIRRTVVRIFAVLALTLGLLAGIGAATIPTASASEVSTNGVGNPFQHVKVAPFSRAIKVSDGPSGWGWRETVKAGHTAVINVYSVQIPAHCVLQTNHSRINHSYRNDGDKSKWVNGKISSYGTTTMNMVCRAGGFGW